MKSSRFVTCGSKAVEPAQKMPSADEMEWVARLRQGDERACEQLVRTFSDRMLAVARRILRCEEDCADAVQDTLLGALQSIHDFKGHSRLSTWLHRLTVNTCLMRLRSRSTRPMISIEGAPAGFRESAICRRRESSGAGDSSDVAADQEVCSRVRACIDDLPEPYREIILLRDIQEIDTDRTARLLGASRSNVETRLHRARRALRPLLEPVFQSAFEPNRAA